MKHHKINTIILSCFLMIICLVINGCEEYSLYETIQTIDAGNGRKILLQHVVHNYWDLYSEYYVYSVVVGTDMVVDKANLYPHKVQKETFQGYISADGNVAGVVNTQNPYEWIILHDFEHNVSWPESHRYDHEGDNLKKTLREKILETHPDVGIDGLTQDRQYLESLTELDLSDYHISAQHLKRLKGLQNLHMLDLSNGDITNDVLQALPGLDSVETLILQYNPISDAGVQPLTRFNNLKFVNLWNTHTTKHCLQDLSKLPRLEEFRIGEDVFSETPSITDSDLLYISKMKNLRKLYLPRAQVTDEGMIALSKLSKLERLWLDNTQISDEGLKIIASLRMLNYLSVRGCPITDRGLQYLIEQPTLSWLVFDDTNISSTTIDFLQRKISKVSIYKESEESRKDSGNEL